MGCECQQSQTGGFGIGVFISSRVSSPLTPKQKPCCGWKLSWAGASCPSALPGGSPILSFTLPSAGWPHWGACRSLPCSGCTVAVSVLLQPASAPPQLKAHQQICLFFSQHTSLCVCKPHSGSPNLGVCFPIGVLRLPGWEEETPPNPAWAVLLLLLKPTKAHSLGAAMSPQPSLCFARNSPDRFIYYFFPSFSQDVCVHGVYARVCAYSACRAGLDVELAAAC